LIVSSPHSVAASECDQSSALAHVHSFIFHGNGERIWFELYLFIVAFNSLSRRVLGCVRAMKLVLNLISPRCTNMPVLSTQTSCLRTVAVGCFHVEALRFYRRFPSPNRSCPLRLGSPVQQLAASHFPQSFQFNAAKLRKRRL
jgi:hypothetical protein